MRQDRPSFPENLRVIVSKESFFIKYTPSLCVREEDKKNEKRLASKSEIHFSSITRERFQNPFVYH